ncbi:hypothetical protein ANCCAN_15476 [Ancylostoma caninum]|uniref:Uncharacterized protein n=1 Tax=Ancylostoma caninum TaxID=29170 RepID=A0A368G7E7_ANCCA|nr:hypothetical protein ANCCAN_15476 [Ancylostoma caninum]
MTIPTPKPQLMNTIKGGIAGAFNKAKKMVGMGGRSKPEAEYFFFVLKTTTVKPMQGDSSHYLRICRKPHAYVDRVAYAAAAQRSENRNALKLHDDDKGLWTAFTRTQGWVSASEWSELKNIV